MVKVLGPQKKTVQDLHVNINVNALSPSGAVPAATVAEPRSSKHALVSSPLLVAVLTVTLGASFQFGFATGFVNNTVVYIKDYMFDNGYETDEAHFMWMWSLFVSAFGLGGIAGCFIFPPFADLIGRKRTILLTVVFYMISCPLTAFPGLLGGWPSLILSRFLIGFGTGGATGIVPMFISEISSAKTRGMLGTVHQLLITIGIVTSLVLSTGKFHIFGSEAMWQYMELVPVFCCLQLLCILPFCAESPVYLYKKHGREAAVRALFFYHRFDPKEADLIEEEINMDDGEQFTVTQIMHYSPLRRAVVCGIMVNLSMQLSGIDAVLYYSTTIFFNADISLDWAEVSTTLVGAINVLVTVLAMLIMDSAGRKALQCTGLAGMSLSYFVLTFAMVMNYQRLAVAAMFGVIIFFAFGPGCIAWFIVAEMVPMHARVFATSMGLGLNWIANWFVAFIFPHLLDYCGHWTFVIFVFSTIFFCLCTYFWLPETKGKTIKDISTFFDRTDAADNTN
eukprot:GEMP01037785.1.p1 GENE.GEMP01037785.1~~GEMP01037785.1.p1  ORF type:complete len:507 (-),score=90.04 GEMP01037785.1:398-1918(-)